MPRHKSRARCEKLNRFEAEEGQGRQEKKGRRRCAPETLKVTLVRLVVWPTIKMFVETVVSVKQSMTILGWRRVLSKSSTSRSSIGRNLTDL